MTGCICGNPNYHHEEPCMPAPDPRSANLDYESEWYRKGWQAGAASPNPDLRVLSVAARIRAVVGSLVGWATSNHAMSRDEAKAAIDDVEAALAASPSPGTDREPVVEYGFCGSLDWTVKEWGRVTHKHSCPNRTDPFCQTHPEGCPVPSPDTDREDEIERIARIIAAYWSRRYGEGDAAADPKNPLNLAAAREFFDAGLRSQDTATARIAAELRAVKMTDEQVRTALDSLGRPGTLAEGVVWAATEAFLRARAVLSGKP